VHEAGAAFARCGGERARARAVDALRELRLALRAIDRGVGRSIDDDLRLVLVHGTCDRLRIGDVEVRVGEGTNLCARRCELAQRAPHLAAGAGDQHPHR